MQLLSTLFYILIDFDYIYCRFIAAHLLFNRYTLIKQIFDGSPSHMALSICVSA